MSDAGATGLAILVLDIVPLFDPPESDRERLLLALLRALGAHGEVTLLTCLAGGGRGETLLHASRVREIRILGRQALDDARRAVHDAGLGGAPDLAHALAFEDTTSPYAIRARELAADASIVLHLTVLTSTILADVDVPEAYLPSVPATALVTPELHDDPAAQAFLKLLRLERSLCMRAVAIFAPSEIADTYRILHGVGEDRLRPSPLAAAEPAAAADLICALASERQRHGQPVRPAPMILALNDYDVSRVESGGMVRIVRLLHTLQHPVLLICLGDRPCVTAVAPGVLVLTVPKTADHRTLESAVDRNQPVTTGDLSSALMAPRNPLLHAVLGLVAPQAALCILEHCYMASLLPRLRKLRPDLKIIYSAHNVESEHRPPMLAGHSFAPILSPLVLALERLALDTADAVIACTPGDAAVLRSSNTPAIVVQNGCDIVFECASPASESNHRVGFVGSHHRPNVDAADFIVGTLAPAFPDIRFEFVGGVCGAIHGQPPNVILHGILPLSAKTEILSGWSIALNPVCSGGGSSLKLPDYLAHGLPIISTPEGARGFDIGLHGAGVLVPLKEFANSLKGLLDDVQARRDLAGRALAYARDSLRWSIVAIEYRKAVASLLGTATPSHVGRSLLFVSEVCGDPARSDHAPLAIEIIDVLRDRFDRIDHVAVDRPPAIAASLAQAAPSAAQAASRRIGEAFDQVRLFPAEHIHDAKRLHEIELAAQTAYLEGALAVARAWGSRLPKTAREPRLLGGLYSREWDGGRHFHWSRGRFGFLLPRGTISFGLDVNNPAGKPISVRVRAAGASEWVDALAACNDASTCRVVFPPDLWCAPVFCEFVVPEHEAPPDPRLFGIAIYRVSVSILPTLGWDNGRPLAFVEEPIDLTSPLFEEATVSNAWAEVAATVLREMPADGRQAIWQALAVRSPRLAEHIAASASRYNTILFTGGAALLADLDMPALAAGHAALFELSDPRGLDPLVATAIGLNGAAGTPALIARAGDEPGARLELPSRRYDLPAGMPTRNTYQEAYALVPLTRTNERLIAFVQRAAALSPIAFVVTGPFDEKARRHLALPIREPDEGLYAGAACIICVDPASDIAEEAARAWGWGRPLFASASLARVELLAAGPDEATFGTAEELAALIPKVLVEDRSQARIGAAQRLFAWSAWKDHLLDFFETDHETKPACVGTEAFAGLGLGDREHLARDGE